MRGTLVRLEPGFLTAPALFMLYAAGVSENAFFLAPCTGCRPASALRAARKKKRPCQRARGPWVRANAPSPEGSYGMHRGLLTWVRGAGPSPRANPEVFLSRPAYFFHYIRRPGRTEASVPEDYSPGRQMEQSWRDEHPPTVDEGIVEEFPVEGG